MFNKIKWLCCVCFLLLPTIGHAATVANASTNGAASDVSLEDLASTPTPFPACRDIDYYWYEQTGPDLVHIKPVDSKVMVLNADQITGQESGAHLASGNVVGYQNGQTINSDWLIYDQHNAHATAGDQFILSREYDIVKGGWLDYYLNLSSGSIKQATIIDSQRSLFARTDAGTILNQKQMQLGNAYITTCDPNHPSWHIQANNADIDYYSNQGTTTDATFYAESLPIIPLPYMNFPLDSARKSGFLMPEIMPTTTNAEVPSQIQSMVGLPYYWNMAPNYDMTITPRLYSVNGILVSDMFRYMTESGSGSMYTEQVPNDWMLQQYRYYYSLTDTHKLTESLTVGYDYNSVSDNNYFIDFGTFNSIINNVNLNRDVYANYNTGWGNAQVKMQGYETIQPEGQMVQAIYQSLPQVSLNVKPQAVASTGLNIDLKTQYSNFAANTPLGTPIGNTVPLQSGQRTVIYPSLTYPMQNSWGFIKPKFGVDYTNYQLSPAPGVQNNYSVANIGVPVSALDTGLILDRPITLGNSGYVQTLEPRLYYLYVPQVNQNNLPVFDTAPATYSINQLFSENRFVGYDRFNNANDVTMGVSSRIINNNTGNEVANYGIGYRYSITPENSFLYGNTIQQPELFLPEPNLIAEITNHWSKSVSSNANFQYSSIYQNVTAYSAQMMYNPEPYKLLNARFSYQYDLPLLYYAYIPGQTNFVPNGYENQYAVDISGQYPIYGNKWLIEGRTNYDLTLGSLLNFLAGIEYNGGCWAVRAMVEEYVMDVSVGSGLMTYIQFELKGLGSVGPSDPTQDLKLNIPGYLPISTTNSTVH